MVKRVDSADYRFLICGMWGKMGRFRRFREVTNVYFDIFGVKSHFRFTKTASVFFKICITDKI